MRLAAEKELAHIGETQGAADHDMVHELSKRLDALWRYDQYVANAAGQPDLQSFWQGLKEQEQMNVRRLKELIKAHCAADCFSISQSVRSRFGKRCRPGPRISADVSGRFWRRDFCAHPMDHLAFPVAGDSAEK